MQKTFKNPSENSYLWLLKPTHLNRGRGIHVFSTLEQLQSILLSYLNENSEKLSLIRPSSSISYNL